MNVDQVVPELTNFGSLLIAATEASTSREPVDCLLDHITEDDKLVNGLMDRILSSDRLMDRLFRKISSSINTTTNEEVQPMATTDDVTGDTKPTVEPLEEATKQDCSATNGHAHAGEPSLMVTRFLTRVLNNDSLLEELALSLSKLAKPVDGATPAPGMEPMEEIYREYERGEPAPPVDPSKQGELKLCHFLYDLFLCEPAVLTFWFKLIGDDLFAESMLEPVYSSRYLTDLVSERVLDDDRMMEFN